MNAVLFKQPSSRQILRALLRHKSTPAVWAERQKLAFVRRGCSPKFTPQLKAPTNIQLIGSEVAIVWEDGAESYFDSETLRAASPSAEAKGEKDIFGVTHGGSDQKKFPGVRVLGWEKIGNYALRFDFSDGHRTGLYSYEYLRQLAERH